MSEQAMTDNAASPDAGSVTQATTSLITQTGALPYNSIEITPPTPVTASAGTALTYPQSPPTMQPADVTGSVAIVPKDAVAVDIPATPERQSSGILVGSSDSSEPATTADSTQPQRDLKVAFETLPREKESSRAASRVNSAQPSPTIAAYPNQINKSDPDLQSIGNALETSSRSDLIQKSSKTNLATRLGVLTNLGFPSASNTPEPSAMTARSRFSTKAVMKRPPLWKYYAAFADALVPGDPDVHSPRIKAPAFEKITRWLLSLSPGPEHPHYTWLVVTFYILWISGFLTIILYNWRSAWTEYGPPRTINCMDSLWSGDGCGLDGAGCQPFSNTSLIVRCVPGCKSARLFMFERWLGLNKGMVWPLVIGDNHYRADSLICASAVHAGAYEDNKGGCFQVRTTGARTTFPNATRNGISSARFDGWFPKSFEVLKIGNTRHCEDIGGYTALPLNLFMFLILMLLKPTKQLTWWTVFLIGYWHVVFISDAEPSLEFVSRTFGTIFGASAIAYILFKKYASTTLPGPGYPIDTYFLFVLPFFFGIYINQWSRNLPPLTLTPKAFKDPTLRAMMLLGGLVVLILAVYQMWQIRRLRLLPWYVGGYIAFAAAYAALPAVFDLTVHLHHWLFGIMLIPLTKAQLRMSLIFCAILLGVFTNGAARWDLASPLEYYPSATTERSGRPVPTWVFNATEFSNTGVVVWRYLPVREDADWLPHSTWDTSYVVAQLAQQNTSSHVVDRALAAKGIMAKSDLLDTPAGMWLHGYTLLVNDVVAYRGVGSEFNLSRYIDKNDTTPYYLRVALFSEGSTLDYTDPIKVFRNGTIFFADGTPYAPLRTPSGSFALNETVIALAAEKAPMTTAPAALSSASQQL